MWTHSLQYMWCLGVNKGLGVQVYSSKIQWLTGYTVLDCMLLQCVTSEMPYWSSNIMKYKIRLGADDLFQDDFKKRRIDF